MQATFPSAATPYPVRVEGHLEQPSRGLWLIKWLLLVPHYVVLAFLWLAFALLSVAAFVAVLFTGRYPRGIFDFNVGVLRWSWRAAFYAFAANGTDRYPPFTLADVPDYPARLEIAYPERHRKGLPLIGWWLAGLPHYVVAGLFAGCAGTAAWTWDRAAGPWLGVIDVLVLAAVLVLLFRGVYPRSIFDLVLGFDRWVIRVAAYAAVMTPEYPPFRVDVGETEAGGLIVGDALPAAEVEAPPRRWTAGRVAAVVIGSVLTLVSLGVLAGGTVGVVFDQTQRDAAGYLMTDSQLFATQSYALVSDSYRAGVSGDVGAVRDVLGTVRVTVRSSEPVFVGIGRAASVDSYLAGVDREVASRFESRAAHRRLIAGTAPAARPTAKRFWSADAVGAGSFDLTWQPQSGGYRIVLMRPDGSRGVAASLGVGARFPHLLALALGLIGGGVLGLVVGTGILYAAVRRRS
jgi:Domain of unknown function (DUF4389)